MATRLASGYIDLSVRYSSAQKQIAADFNKLPAQAQQAGSKAGAAYGASLSAAASRGAANAGRQATAQFQSAAIAQGQRVGHAVGTVIGKGIGAGLKLGMVGAAGAVSALGYTLTKGFQRLEKIDQARFKLEALGNSAADVNEIMKNAEASVKGTAFALDEAAQSAASAVAAGVKPGKQLTKYLTNIADTAAVAGTGFAEMASIFNKVTTNNKAYTDDLQQLADRGVPVFQLLREQYGVTADELQKMVEGGKVSAADLSTALEGKLGGAALKMGESFTGAMDNAQAAIARVGAKLLGSVFGGGAGGALDAPKDAVNALTDQLNKAGIWIDQNQDKIHQFFMDAKEVGKAFVDAVGPPLKAITDVLREHPGLIQGVVVAFAAWKTIEGIAAVTTALKAVSTLLATTIPASAATGAAATAASWAPVFAAFKLLPLAGVGLGGVKDSADLGLPQVVTGPDGKLTLDSGVGPQGGGPNASNQRRGLPSVDPTGGLLMPSTDGDYGLPAGSNSGGYGGGGVDFPGWVDQIADAFGIKPSTYSGHQESNRNEPGYAPNPNGENRGIDWSGPVENMQRFAEYLATVPGAAEQVIWQNPNTGAAVEIAGGQQQPGYFSADLGGHQDHVHTRQSAPIPLPPGLQPKPFDTGGWWKDGELGINTTGEDELVLNPDHLDQLAKDGVDPNSLLHGGGQGAAPGPGMPPPPDLLQQLAGQGSGQGEYKPVDPASLGERTAGYIPAAAGNTSVAGTSFLSGIYGMGAEVINGMIDQAASVASSAVGMAASAFAPGSGGAAAGAAQAGIGMATGAIKRGVEYGAQMLGIGTDALIEQLTPFGAPRLLTTDPTGFMPQQLLSGAIGKMMAPGQGMPGMPGQPPAPGMTPPPGVATDHPGTGAAPGVPNPPGPPPGIGQTVGQAQPDPNQMTALDFLKPIVPTVHDQGGWLPPGGLAMNLTKKAEPMPVFNHDQWGTLNSIANNPVSEPAMAGAGPQYNYTIHTTVKDVKELERQMVDRRQLDSMRYRGRPR